jgi:hypothetical protein
VLRDSGERRDETSHPDSGEGKRFVRFEATDTGWRITFDPA